MARTAKRLSARAVATLTKPGMHADGDGLYLVVSKSGAKRWTFIYQGFRKAKESGQVAKQYGRKEMGLGRLAEVSLAEAREKVAEARKLVAAGIDPVEAREAAKADQMAPKPTFGSFADSLVDDLASGFRNEKHLAQWRMTLTKYAKPLRNKPLDQIETPDVLAVLKPIWQEKNETASRLRGRIERVLDAAKAQGLRTGENPARWRGHLDKLLPKRHKLQRGHHAAMAYAEVPEFMGQLRARGGITARALEWTILAAARSGEALGARWEEIDRENRLWTIPAERMKAARPHRVPLTDRMLEILDEMALAKELGPFVFPGQRRGKGLSVMSLTMQLRRMGRGEVTVHGFRSSFRDWAAEQTHFAREIAEAALAHVVGDATERAYRRGDALERRRELMTVWERYCTVEAQPNVINLKR